MLIIANNLGVLPKYFFPQGSGKDYELSPYLIVLAVFGGVIIKTQERIDRWIAPWAAGTASFTFSYAGKMVTPPVAFNSYPVSVNGYTTSHNTNDQNIVNAADGTGSGLPYSIVATQHDVTP